MLDYPNKEALKAALWDRILIPELYTPSFLRKNGLYDLADIKLIEDAARNRFIDSLLEHARPEHVEFVMQQAVQKKYTPILTLHDGVSHLHESLKAKQIAQKDWLLPYTPGDGVAGCATRGYTVNALGMVDEHGRLRADAAGELVFDPHFTRRVVHETAHVLDFTHPHGAYGYSELSTAYKQARTQDRFHARIMECMQGVMERNGTHVLSAEDKEALAHNYKHLKKWYEGRARAPRNDGKTFMAPSLLPDTMEEYFARLPEENGIVSERMGALLERNPALAHDPLNAYSHLLREQYAEFGGITDDREFFRTLRNDITENVRNRITEIDYYKRDDRMSESIAKAIDGFNVNLNHAERPLVNGRNPLAAMHLPHMEEHVETHVYEDLHRRNVKERAAVDAELKPAWEKAGLDPQEQKRLREEYDAARKAHGPDESYRQRDLQAERRREARRARRKQDQEAREKAEKDAAEKDAEAKTKEAAENELKAKAAEPKTPLPAEKAEVSPTPAEPVLADAPKPVAEPPAEIPAPPTPVAEIPPPVEKPADIPSDPPMEAEPGAPARPDVTPIDALPEPTPEAAPKLPEPALPAAAPVVHTPSGGGGGGGGGYSGGGRAEAVASQASEQIASKESQAVRVVEGAASHGNKTAQIALTVGGLAAGGWALLETLKRQKPQPDAAGKLGFQSTQDVTVGNKGRFSHIERDLSTSTDTGRKLL